MIRNKQKNRKNLETRLKNLTDKIMKSRNLNKIKPIILKRFQRIKSKTMIILRSKIL